MKSVVRGAVGSGWEKQPGERGEGLEPGWETRGLQSGTRWAGLGKGLW